MDAGFFTTYTNQNSNRLAYISTLNSHTYLFMCWQVHKKVPKESTTKKCSTCTMCTMFRLVELPDAQILKNSQPCQSCLTASLITHIVAHAMWLISLCVIVLLYFCIVRGHLRGCVNCLGEFHAFPTQGY